MFDFVHVSMDGFEALKKNCESDPLRDCPIRSSSFANHLSRKRRLWVHKVILIRIVGPQSFSYFLRNKMWKHKFGINRIVDPQVCLIKVVPIQKKSMS